MVVGQYKTYLCLLLAILMLLAEVTAISDNEEVGYRIGKVKGYKKLK